MSVRRSARQRHQPRIEAAERSPGRYLAAMLAATPPPASTPAAARGPAQSAARSRRSAAIARLRSGRRRAAEPAPQDTLDDPFAAATAAMLAVTPPPPPSYRVPPPLPPDIAALRLAVGPTAQHAAAADDDQHRAPYLTLIPHLDSILAEIERLDLYISERGDDNTQSLEKRIENYPDILNQAQHIILPELAREWEDMGGVDNSTTEEGNELIIRIFEDYYELTHYFAHQEDVWEAYSNRLLAGAQGWSDEPDWNIGKNSKIFRTNLTNAVENLKAHIENRPLPHRAPTRGGKKSRRRRRKKSHKGRRKKNSGLTRRKKRSRRNRCK